MRRDWRPLAAVQEGILARRQLVGLGYRWDHVQSNIAAERWTALTPRVVSTFTGTPTWRQRAWAAVLHAGGTALVGGLSALEAHGLGSWHREEITVLVDDQLSFEEVEGVRYFRTRRDLARLRHPRSDLPLCRVEPAALLFAGYEPSRRTAQGLLAAVVQQRLTAVPRLADELDALRPLPRARLFRTVLHDLGGGAQSLAEIDVRRMCRRAGLPLPRRQVRRRDSAGRVRYLDCEWLLPDGSVLVLEVDGSFHMEVERWEDDIARQRRLSGQGRVVVRCTARELRDEPEVVVEDLVALGLTRSCA